jgi:eukaryotic-like serine/threonine-protein kinase
MTRFRFGDHIGSGGFGSVEEAYRIDDDGEILEEGLAQKKLLSKWEEDAEALARFRREVRFLTEMDHPNILPVLGRNLSAKPPWFVMPRAETSLLDQIEEGRHYDEQWVTKSFGAVLAGMTYAHAQRRIHRDLKPENVLIVDGTPMISDFGLGKRMDPDATDLTQTHMAMGTVAYMAPEQFTDAAHVGPGADVYALGKLLVHMVTGTKPLVGRPKTIELPFEFRSFIEKCCADHPSERYANAADAAAAFQLLVADEERFKGNVGVEGLLTEWETTPLGDDAEAVHNIAMVLVSQRDNEELLWKVLPRLPDQLVEQIMGQHAGEFDLILRAYDGHIQGGLPFEYCDVVANFYRRIYRATDDIGHKQLILERLIELGPSHNRWHVGDVFARVLEGIEQSPEIDMAAELIREHPTRAIWFEDYVRNRPIPAPIAKAFAAARTQPDDDLPF